MAKTFDPYHKWLGIPPKEQPPHHYRLLAIELFESDADVIENAADRQMAHVRTFQTGPYSAESQKLLNQLAAAKICLLNAEKKVAYDQELKARLSAAQSALAAGLRPTPAMEAIASVPKAVVPLPAPAGVRLVSQTVPPATQGVWAERPQPVAPPRQYTAVFRGQANARRRLAIIAASSLGLVAIIIALVVGGFGDRLRDLIAVQSVDGERVTDRQHHPKRTRQTEAQRSGSGSERLSNSAGTTTGQSANRSSSARSGTGEHPTSPRPTGGPPSWASGAVLALDLDGSSTFRQDGEQYLRDFSLQVNDGEVFGGTFAPGKVGQALMLGSPPNYVECADSPSLNPTEALTVAAWIKADSWPRQGVANIVAKEDWDAAPRGYVLRCSAAGQLDLTIGAADWQTAFAGSGMELGQWHHVVGTYDRQTLRVYVDGTEKGTRAWTAPIEPSAYPLRIGSSSFARDRQFAGAVDEVAIWSRALSADEVRQLYEHNRAGRSHGPLIAGNAKVLSPAPRVIDLLKLVNLNQHVVEGNWQIEGGALVAGGGGWPRVQIPVEPLPDEYLLNVVAERIEGDNLLGIGLVSGGRQVLAVIDSQGQSGLHAVDGVNGFANDITPVESRPFAPGRTSTISCIVRKTGISVFSNGEQIIAWKGDHARLKLGPGWDVSDPQALILGVWAATFRISTVELTPISATTSEQRSPNHTAGAGSMPTLGDLLNPVRRPVPEQAARDEAIRRIKKDLVQEFDQARQPAARIALARKLLDQAMITSGKPAEEYVLLEQAAGLASQSAELSLAGAALDELARRFDVEPLPMKESALMTAAKLAQAPADFRALAQSWVALVNQAVAVDRYDDAARFAGRALAAARKSPDELLSRLIVAGTEDLQAIRAAFEQVKTARNTLSQVPDDQEANDLWGRFCCIYKDDWKAGLPLWARGDSNGLAALAGRDLAEPANPSMQVELADAWWKAAIDEPEPVPKRRLQARATHWYRLALPQMSLSDASQMQHRIDEAEQAASHCPLDQWIDLLGSVDPARHSVAGQWQRRGKQLLTAQPSEPAGFMIPVAPSGSYDLDFKFTLGSGTEVIAILPVGDRSCELVLGGWGGQTHGLHLIDGRSGQDNVTTVRGSSLPVRQRQEVKIHVETAGDRAKIDVDLSGRKLIRWEGALASLATDGVRKPPKPGTLGLVAHNAAAIFHSARLRMNSGAARLVD